MTLSASGAKVLNSNTWNYVVFFFSWYAFHDSAGFAVLNRKKKYFYINMIANILVVEKK